MLTRVLWTELLKLRHSKVTWGTLVAFSIGPFGLALFMWILRAPERAAQMGLLGAKANLSGLEATWTSYASALTLLVGMGGMVLLPFVVAFVFGREYAELTAKDMLVLPVPRHWFVLSKLSVSAAWWIALVAFVVSEAILVGLALGLDGFSVEVVAAVARNTLLAAGIAFLLVPPVAWFTTLGRGYMPPLAFALAMLALGNVFGKTGWAPWFPWSIIPMLVGSVGRPVDALPVSSFVVLAMTFAGGVVATAAQLRFADTAQ